jgi:ABC-type sugar transport system substrate-binding protein
MENCLSKNSGINVVYSINEPAGEGASAALKAAGKTAQIYSIDGSCDGLKNVTSGVFTADSAQYPGKMAALGVSSIAKGAGGANRRSPAARTSSTPERRWSPGCDSRPADPDRRRGQHGLLGLIAQRGS